MNTSGATRVRSASRRGLPIAVVGRVNVLAPTGSGPYYRLTWTQPDGKPGRTSGGRTKAGALAKAAGLDAGLARAAGAKAMTTLDVVAEDYLSSPVGRNQKTGGDWDPSQLRQMRAKVNRVVRAHTQQRAMDVDRKLLDLMRSQAGTPRTRKENATTLRGLLRWGATQGYFTAEQAELLPVNVYDLAGEVAGTQAPKRRTRVREVGESENYISDEDAPNRKQLVALGEALQLPRDTGRLAAELAADSGPRWAEQFQLTAEDVKHTPARTTKKGKVQKARVHLQIDWQIDSGAKAGGKRRKPPKGKKRRRAGVGAVSITGYQLHDALLARAAEAKREQAAGTNPEALLFPTENGDLFFYTAFSNDYFKPAALAAGWPRQEWTYVGHKWHEASREWRLVTEDRVQFDLTWHSLRHRYARTCIDIREFTAGELMAHGGWENETVVKNLYYSAGEEHFDSGSKKL